MFAQAAPTTTDWVYSLLSVFPIGFQNYVTQSVVVNRFFFCISYVHSLYNNIICYVLHFYINYYWWCEYLVYFSYRIFASRWSDVIVKHDINIYTSIHQRLLVNHTTFHSAGGVIGNNSDSSRRTYSSSSRVSTELIER